MDKKIKLIFDRLGYAYRQSGKTYVELEKMTGISKSALQRYINGSTKKVPIDVVQAIAVATGVSAAWIMGWEETPPDKKIHKNPPEIELTEGEELLLDLFRKIPDDKKQMAIELLKVALQVK